MTPVTHPARIPFAVLLVTLLAVPGRAAAPTAPRLVPLAHLGIPIVLMHQVSNDPIHTAHGVDNVTEPWLSPAAFEGFLAQLQGRGYHVIALSEALDYFAGKRSAASLPPEPVVLTFDDGYETAWTTATPILRAYHDVATMFFEGERTGTTPGRLTLAELRAMERSGVWTLESHGWAGHDTIQIDAHGDRSFYWYANLAYLPAQHRLETKSEFEARVQADLAHFRAVFEPALGTKLDVFAYPSGEFGQDASLAPGGDPNTLLGAGHSNASGLTPLLFWALRTDGFRAALAVSLPGEAHAASRQDRAYALPRLGIGATSSFASVTALHTDGFELPGITSSDRIPDFGPLAADGDGYVSAAHATPTLVRLAADGRIEQTYQLPALLADRPGRPALISALVALGGRRFAILQQAGWWPGATPQETIVADRGDRLAMLARNPLPATLNWTVGACRWNGRLVAMTDEGRIYDLVSGSLLVTIPVGADSVRHDRFAGPAVAAGNLYVYDRHRRALRIFAAAGNELASDPLGGEIRQLLGDGDLLLAVDWSDMRHIVRRFEIEP